MAVSVRYGGAGISPTPLSGAWIPLTYSGGITCDTSEGAVCDELVAGSFGRVRPRSITVKG